MRPNQRTTLAIVSVMSLLCASPTRAATRGSAQCREALSAWQLGDARRSCAQALLDAPEDAAARLSAAEALHQLGRFATAQALLESLNQGPEDDATLVPRHALSAAGQGHYEYISPRITAAFEITRGMQHIDSPHFVQWYADKDEIVASFAVPVLERAFVALMHQLDFDPSHDGEKIHVIWQPKPEDLARSTGLTPANIETSGTIAVCKFHQLLVLSPAATSGGYDWADTLAHELVHLFVAKKTHDNTPVWLHEGLAKFFQSSWRGAPGQALDRAALDELKAAARKQELISLERMHPSMAKLPSQKAAALAFTEVTTLIADVHRRLGKAAIAALLADLGRGVSLERVLEQHLHTSLSGMFARLKTLARSEGLLVPLVAQHAFDEQPIALKAPGSEDAGSQDAPQMTDVRDDTLLKAARLAELLELRGHIAAAIPYLERACARAKHRHVALDVRLARLLREHNEPARARDLLLAAEALHPYAAAVQLELGLALSALEDWTKASEKLLASMQHNPFNAQAHEALGHSYAALGRSDDAAREKTYTEMCRRTRRAPSEPKTLELGAYVNVLSADWGPHLLDNQSIVTPAWRLPVAPGRHTLAPQSLRGAKPYEAVAVTIEPGRTGWLRTSPCP